MRVYEAIVKGLEDVGVTAAFGGAGENAAGMMIALKNSASVRGVISRHEQAASFMACGYAMYTDRLGVCFATAGPGAFNLFSGLAVALSDSYPVLAISGFANLDWRGKGSLNETSGLARTPDSQAMFAATTKKSVLLDDIGKTADVLEDLIHAAFEGRPGPVHLHVPENLAHPDVKVPNWRRIGLKVAPVTPDPNRVAEVAGVLTQALAKGKKVLVLAGFGAIRAGAGAELKAFVERFQTPFATTQDGKGVVSEHHPLAVGVFCDSGHASAWKAFLAADVVLCVGNALNQHATFNYKPDLFAGKTLIHLNISEGEIDKAYKADYAIVGDAKLSMAALLAAMAAAQPSPQPFTPKSCEAEMTRPLAHLTGKIHPGQMAQSISRLLPKDAIVLADAGAHLTWMAYYLRLDETQLFRKAGEFGPMAGHTNGAIGLRAAIPDRPIVVCCGDGCYNLAGFELMTAVQYDLPVIWVIFDDAEFKLIKLFQLETFHESGLVEFTNPDWAAYATACGADGVRVESLDGFEAAFIAALASGRPTVIDAHITRLALPHYAPSPEGIVGEVVEKLKERVGLE
jgi:acetolactate synthase-1/2/3 large subunit